MPNELTNPDTVVTEERLYQFYQQILPYMGGMPDVLANKFNRADLYSTDEKLIGRWIDGKPLYQKTVTINALPNATTTEYDVGLTNVSYCSLSGYILFPSGNKATIPHVDVTNVNSGISFQGNANGKVSVAVRADRSNCSAVVTLQYTKTTDSAVEIGSDTDYSTTEKIVGTWIDGKPIWQKSFDITETTIHGANAFEITLLSNVDKMISQNFMFMDEDLPNGKPIPKASWIPHDGYTHVASGYWYASFFYINPTTHDLKMRRDGNSGVLHLYGTILYTKTSS